MSREVIWTKKRFELVCEEGMLGCWERTILEEHIRGDMSRQQLAMKHNCDISVIDTTIKRLKDVYDAVQKDYPDALEPRCKDVYRRRKRKKPHCEPSPERVAVLFVPIFH